MIKCEIDGNRVNNTFSQTDNLIYTGSANDVLIEDCYIHDAQGNGIVHFVGLRPITNRNRVHNIAKPDHQQSHHKRSSAHHRRLGEQGFYRRREQDRRYFLQTGMTVTSDGSTPVVVSTGSPDFTEVLPGTFLVFNSGSEFFVLSKADNTHVTVNSIPNALTNTPCIAGSGDGISIESSSNVLMVDNRASGFVTGAIVLPTSFPALRSMTFR